MQRAIAARQKPYFFGQMRLKTPVFRRFQGNDCGPAQPPAPWRHGSCNPPNRAAPGPLRAFASAIGVLMWQTLKETFKECTEDKDTRLSAALAFYTMLSLAPLLII